MEHSAPDPAPNQPQDPAQPTPAPEPKPQPHNRKKWLLVLLALLLALLLLAGLLYWWLHDRGPADDTSKNTQSSSQKSTDKKKSAATTDTSTDTETTTGDAACDSTITDTMKENFADAVKSGNYSALVGYMADEVTFVLAASEKGGAETPDQAVEDMKYLDSATAPWDFNLPASVTDVWAANFYGSYFTGNFYAGRASSNQVISYQFDDCGKIDRVFIASDYHLLEP